MDIQVEVLARFNSENSNKPDLINDKENIMSQSEGNGKDKEGKHHSHFSQFALSNPFDKLQFISILQD